MKRVIFVAVMLIAPILSLESAFADPVTFTAKLSSEAQGQQNASPGTGSATVVMDTTTHTLQVSVSFQCDRDRRYISAAAVRADTRCSSRTLSEDA